eukprot:scaffold183895_cov39-Prasinocladus_malaysianus.AAC.1
MKQLYTSLTIALLALMDIMRSHAIKPLFQYATECGDGSGGWRGAVTETCISSTFTHHSEPSDSETISSMSSIH